MDMSQFVVPKSDQLNADDLIGGPRTITITKVSGTGASDQPVAIHYEGGDGKPYKPCKSMRRVMIAAWGVDASAYAGRRMTIYCDPKVAFGGMEVGGIRISHMSDIEKTMNMVLTVTKAKRAPYRVEMLREEKPAGPDGWPMLAPDASLKAAPDAATWIRWCGAAVAKMEDIAALDGWLMSMGPHLAALAPFDAPAVAQVKKAAGDRRAALVEARDA